MNLVSKVLFLITQDVMYQILSFIDLRSGAANFMFSVHDRSGRAPLPGTTAATADFCVIWATAGCTAVCTMAMYAAGYTAPTGALALCVLVTGEC